MVVGVDAVVVPTVRPVTPANAPVVTPSTVAWTIPSGAIEVIVVPVVPIVVIPIVVDVDVVVTVVVVVVPAWAIPIVAVVTPIASAPVPPAVSVAVTVPVRSVPTTWAIASNPVSSTARAIDHAWECDGTITAKTGSITPSNSWTVASSDARSIDARTRWVNANARSISTTDSRSIDLTRDRGWTVTTDAGAVAADTRSIPWVRPIDTADSRSVTTGARSIDPSARQWSRLSRAAATDVAWQIRWSIAPGKVSTPDIAWKSRWSIDTTKGRAVAPTETWLWGWSIQSVSTEAVSAWAVCGWHPPW
jgi:hypothetical protein